MNTDDGLQALVAQAHHPALRMVPAWPASTGGYVPAGGVRGHRNAAAAAAGMLPYAAFIEVNVGGAIGSGGAFGGLFETLRDAGARVAGSRFADTVSRVAQEHGDGVADALVRSVQGSEKLQRAYQARDQLLTDAEQNPTAETTRIAVAANNAIDAAERELISKIRFQDAVSNGGARMTASGDGGDGGDGGGGYSDDGDDGVAGVDWRVLRGVGGWTYRQYADGDIEILEAPAGNERAVGLMLSAAEGSPEWVAITEELGAFQPDAQATAAASSSAPLRLPKLPGMDRAGGSVLPSIVSAVHQAARGNAKGAQKALLTGATSMAIGLAKPTAAALAAGASGASAVPVAGWIAAAGLATAAGTIALVRGLKQRKLTTSRAVQLARKIGLPDADQVPGFTLKVIRLPSHKRNALGDRLARALDRAKRDKKTDKLKVKLQILAAAEVLHREGLKAGLLKKAKAGTGGVAKRKKGGGGKGGGGKGGGGSLHGVQAITGQQLTAARQAMGLAPGVMAATALVRQEVAPLARPFVRR